MNNEKMIKFAQIRSSYARKRFGNLNNDEKALIDYETFCLELIRESDELQQRLDKAIEYINDRYDGEVLTHTFDKCNVGELYEILRGNNE